MFLDQHLVAVLPAIRQGEHFLIGRQSPDGLWRDYLTLEPGFSEAWVTAVVGWSLSIPPINPSTESAVLMAAEALHEIAKTDGWGYNRNTVSDADSTAWVWRFFAQVGDYRRRSPIQALSRFFLADGKVRTFVGTSYGSWSESHADVIPVLGLALLSVHAPPELLNSIRAASLSNRTVKGLWHSFWWATSAYAIARNLEFLDSYGGIPDAVRTQVLDWLEVRPVGVSPFEMAHELAAAICVNSQTVLLRCKALLDLQLIDGGWAASQMLLVPAQHGQSDRELIAAFADECRLMSTALVVAALKSLLNKNTVSSR